jgi:uncharacterized protein
VSVELRPLGVACNLQCQYCYQNPQREAGNVATKYDIAAMKAAVEREGGPFTLFGGEPLLLPMEDLRKLWAWGFERYGQSSIQTNGSLLTREHIDLMLKYRVSVGISMDGPGPLNAARWAGTSRATATATECAERALEDLCEAGLIPSLIVTLHRLNGVGGQLDVLKDWLKMLRDMGVVSARLHLLEVEYPDIQQKYALSEQENLDALLSFWLDEASFMPMRFDIFEDMRRMLIGDDRSTTCIWNGCDPYTTAAVRGVEGFGESSNCGRTNKDGIDYLKSNRPGFERYLSLYHNPQSAGGCRGCRFFLMCKGNCPGTSLRGDWRLRSEHCAIWKALFGRIEGELLARGVLPLSASKERPAVEQAALLAWRAGNSPSIFHLRQLVSERNSR